MHGRMVGIKEYMIKDGRMVEEWMGSGCEWEEDMTMDGRMCQNKDELVMGGR